MISCVDINIIVENMIILGRIKIIIRTISVQELMFVFKFIIVYYILFCL